MVKFMTLPEFAEAIEAKNWEEFIFDTARQTDPNLKRNFCASTRMSFQYMLVHSDGGPLYTIEFSGPNNNHMRLFYAKAVEHTCRTLGNTFTVVCDNAVEEVRYTFVGVPKRKERAKKLDKSQRGMVFLPLT